MVVNFFHFQGFWFFTLGNEKSRFTFRPYEYCLAENFPGDMGEYKLLSKEFLTQRQAKEKLHRMFPEYTLNKMIFYHTAPRNSRGNGSRPRKSFYRKCEYSKKIIAY